MPVFPYEKDVDTHWLNVMDSVAQRNDLTISRRQTGREEEVGDVYELPIECKDWEGTLEALVRETLANYEGFTFERSVDEKELETGEEDDNLYLLRTRVSWGSGKEGYYEELVRIIRKKR